MKFGVCGNLSRLPMIKDAGYDYIEMNFSALALAQEEDFRHLREELARYEFRAEAFNGFFRPDVCLYGPNADLDAISAYAERGFARAKQLGGDVAVFGSGDARAVPEGMSQKAAEEQLCRVLTVCGDAAAKHGMRIAIEPLRASETNIINLLSEGAALSRRVGHPAVGLLIDFFHFYCGGEPMSAITDAADVLIHAHLARPHLDRMMPREEDTETVALWAKTLRAAGYDARLSLEGSLGTDADAAIRATKPFLKLFA